MKRKTWKSKLKKKELKHLWWIFETKRIIKFQLETLFKLQSEMRNKDKTRCDDIVQHTPEPCFECKCIAMKLGYPV